MRVRRAAKPQTGGIRHQNDCLVETSNFSFLSARGCERAASLLWPVVPLFRPLGGRCDRRVRKRGPRTPGSPGTITPGKHWGVQMTEVRGGKAPGVCFRKGPRFPGHHGNPGVPSNNKPAARGHLRTFAARSEAHEALPLVALGFPEPPPRVRRGRDWRKKQQKKTLLIFFSYFFFFFQQKRKFEIQWESLPGKFGCGAKKPPLRVQSDERGVARAGRGRDMLIEARIPRVSAGALGLRESCDLNATTVHPRSQPRSPTSVQATLSPAWNNF